MGKSKTKVREGKRVRLGGRVARFSRRSSGRKAVGGARGASSVKVTICRRSSPVCEGGLPVCI